MIVGYSGNGCEAEPGVLLVKDTWRWKQGKSTHLAYLNGTDAGQ